MTKGKYRFVVNGDNVEILSTDKGIIGVIAQTELPNFIKGLQEIEKNAPTCNAGHTYCKQHHSNWG